MKYNEKFGHTGPVGNTDFKGQVTLTLPPDSETLIEFVAGSRDSIISVRPEGSVFSMPGLESLVFVDADGNPVVDIETKEEQQALFATREIMTGDPDLSAYDPMGGVVPDLPTKVEKSKKYAILVKTKPGVSDAIIHLSTEVDAEGQKTGKPPAAVIEIKSEDGRSTYWKQVSKKVYDAQTQVHGHGSGTEVHGHGSGGEDGGE